MRLRILLPTEVLVDEPASKVVAEAVNGSFGLLPRHVDVATALVPGVLTFVDAGGRERYVAVDDGILVKCGPDVLVSVRNAVQSDVLEGLRGRVASHVRHLDDEQHRARAALARLEAGALRRLAELEERGHAE